MSELTASPATDGEVVGWSYEWCDRADKREANWHPAISFEEPVPSADFAYRNVRPLYTAPPAPKAGEGNRRGIYVASKVAHADMWRDLRQFQSEPIISTWIDEAGVGESASLEDLWRRCVMEASNAGALIIYRRPDEVLKGAWVELGAALASGVPVFAVGIQEFTVANHAGITHCENLIEARKLAREALSSTRTA